MMIGCVGMCVEIYGNMKIIDVRNVIDEWFSCDVMVCVGLCRFCVNTLCMLNKYLVKF